MALHSPGRNAISPEVFNEFSKTFISLKEEEAGYMWLKISSAQTFSFSNSNVTTFPTSQKCKNFNFSLYTVLAEMLYLQKYLTNFQKLFFRWKKRKLTIVVGNFQVHRHFHFAIGNVKTFPTSQKCKNFNFSLYTVLAEMLYLQKYLTNFKKLFFGWKKRKLATVVENLKYTDVFVLL